MQLSKVKSLDGEALDLVTHSADLSSQLTGIVAGDAGSNDRSADTASTTEVHLAAHIHVRNLFGVC